MCCLLYQLHQFTQVQYFLLEVIKKGNDYIYYVLRGVNTYCFLVL